MSTGKGRIHFSVPGGRKKASKPVAGGGENRRHRSERLALCDAEKARAEAGLCQDAKAVFPVLRSAGATLLAFVECPSCCISRNISRVRS